jgi:hypothetical protein
VYVTLALVLGCLVISFTQSTVRQRRGQFGASMASLEELEEI